ncbi:hypothetical protein LMIY3S_02585 [Labrys miyagiensis]
MHRTALSAADTSLAAVDLLHHARDLDALGDAVAVTPVGRGDAVDLSEVHANARRRGLLAGIEMHEARYLAGGEFDVQPFFEIADGPHGAVSPQQVSPIELHDEALPEAGRF